MVCTMRSVTTHYPYKRETPSAFDWVMFVLTCFNPPTNANVCFFVDGPLVWACLNGKPKGNRHLSGSPMSDTNPSLQTRQQEHSDLVVGIDVCGNPSKPSVTPYLLPALLAPRISLRWTPLASRKAWNMPCNTMSHTRRHLPCRPHGYPKQ